MAQLPHRTAKGAEAAAVFDALRTALPPQDAYDLESLSCTWVSMPRYQSTACVIDGKTRIEKADELAEAFHRAGAQIDMRGKMPSVIAKKVHLTRDTFSFDDQANISQPWVPNVRLQGSAAHDVMTALAGAGVNEDNGTLFVVCSKFKIDPECGYQLHGAIGPVLDRAQAQALWNAFVHDPNTTLLNASHFALDGDTLTFFATLDTVRPPS